MVRLSTGCAVSNSWISSITCASEPRITTLCSQPSSATHRGTMRRALCETEIQHSRLTRAPNSLIRHKHITEHRLSEHTAVICSGYICWMFFPSVWIKAEFICGHFSARWSFELHSRVAWWTVFFDSGFWRFFWAHAGVSITDTCLFLTPDLSTNPNIHYRLQPERLHKSFSCLFWVLNIMCQRGQGVENLHTFREKTNFQLLVGGEMNLCISIFLSRTLFSFFFFS